VRSDRLISDDPLSRGYVLVVDDDEAICAACRRVLESAGHRVETVCDAAAATALLQRGGCDAVVSDIHLPGMNGVELVRAVRAHDLDVPVLLMTAVPSLESALRALELGALRYLLKPVAPADLATYVGEAVKLHRLARAKRELLQMIGNGDKLVGDRAGLMATFERALESVWIAYQPIVSWRDRRAFGYEALLRSAEPALPHPGALLDAAERLGRLDALGRRVRELAPAPLAGAAADQALFVNLHVRDLLDDTLYARSSALGQAASRIVLEITERAALDGIDDVRARVRTLKEIGYRIAVDDLGAGYAGLTTFALLEPDVVKLDMSLVRDVDASPVKQKLVTAMTSVAHDLGIIVVAEGVETVREREALAAIGCDLLQGYLFARPGRPFPEVAW